MSVSRLTLRFSLLPCVLCLAACPDGSEDVPTSATAGETSPTTGVEPTTGESPTSDGEPSTGEEPTTAMTDASGTSTDSDPSSTTDAPSVCGDGQVDPGEECDWGMGNSEESGCTPDCELAQCGDGYVQLGVEECDEGLANSDEGACTLECLEARCGDDKVFKGVEECDDGDTPTEKDPVVNDDDAYGGCTTACTWGPRCGDGILQEGEEECDGGDEPDPAVCSDMCTVLTRVVFVSSAVYLGDLGGIEAADQVCRDLAETAGLGHSESFRAWLSGGGKSPLDWPVDPSNRYQLPSGMIVADDWAHLVSGGLKVALGQTEEKYVLSEDDLPLVWTGTLADGSSASWTCNGWSPEIPGLVGRYGLATSTDEHWTDYMDIKCNSYARLYCVEVW